MTPCPCVHLFVVWLNIWPTPLLICGWICWVIVSWRDWRFIHSVVCTYPREDSASSKFVKCLGWVGMRYIWYGSVNPSSAFLVWQMFWVMANGGGRSPTFWEVAPPLGDLSNKKSNHIHSANKDCDWSLVHANSISSFGRTPCLAIFFINWCLPLCWEIGRLNLCWYTL